MKITDYDQVWDIWLNSKDKLRAFALSKFGNPQLADEATQEVLLKVHKSCCSEREINNLDSWLFQITNNVSLDILKKESRDRSLTYETEDHPDDQLWTELSAFLEPLIECLPEKYAVPLRMSDLERLPQKEIADSLGLQLSAAKSRIQRARLMLKEQIRACFHMEVDKNNVPINLHLKDSCQSLQDWKKNN